MARTPDQELDAHLRTSLAALPQHFESPGWSASGVAQATAHADDPGWWWRLYEAQLRSRQLDLVARQLQRQGRGFYTISSAGHEGNALVALALRASDPALLHYRSGAFYCARATQVPGTNPVRDVLQGLVGAAAEPIAGGRHKVFGHGDLAIIPQTSTIASHLPRSVGLALSLRRAERLGVDSEWPADSVVVCSFGDASANHSTAVGAINAAVNAAFRGLPVPLLFVCEDNGLGISVPTPVGWIEAAYSSRPGLGYVVADGADPQDAAPKIEQAVRLVRERQTPVFLHLRTVRYLAHAGSDAEITYRSRRQLDSELAADPILGTARSLRAQGATVADLLTRMDGIRDEVDAAVTGLGDAAPLSSAPEVMGPISPHRPDVVIREVVRLQSAPVPDQDRPRRTLAESINATLAELLATDRRVMVFGEDVATKGGVYGVTRGLVRRFGRARVFDTILDEQSVLGLGLGAGLAGLVPIPEIQYLAYLHNAEDQLRGEAASLSFFSQGRYRNPMVVRIAGLAYQKGFGGHFHNDNALAVLRDIPGLVVACPSRGDDAAAMLRTCVAAGLIDGTVSVFLEPIALYHSRDLHAVGDAGWLTVDDGTHVPVGRARSHGPDEADLTMITFGNGVPMSLRVAARLRDQGIIARVCDLRWLAPLPIEDVLTEIEITGRVLVVDETRHDGGVGEGVVTGLVERGFRGPLARVSSLNSFVPLGIAAQHVLLGEDEIEKAAQLVAGMDRTP
ncbi:MAG: thiamine pyrophosphate-dependent enzyme [Microlunatus sp.]|nr:thiamine pyrophosphate-dependent enzyme [Microlunatus sp.]